MRQHRDTMPHSCHTLCLICHLRVVLLLEFVQYFHHSVPTLDSVISNKLEFRGIFQYDMRTDFFTNFSSVLAKEKLCFSRFDFVSKNGISNRSITQIGSNID